MGSIEGTSPHRARGIPVASHERTMESTGRSFLAPDNEQSLLVGACRGTNDKDLGAQESEGNHNYQNNLSFLLVFLGG